MAGYIIIDTDTPIQHRDQVAVFCRPAPHFVVEAIQKFGPNVVGFQLEMGERQWYIVGCYLDPNNNLTIESAVDALK